MHRPLLFTATLLLAALTGCVSKPTTATKLDPQIRAKIDKGIVEPGFTPEMVYLALGKPSVPADGLVDQTTNGTWIYHDYHRNDRDFIKAGFRRRVVFDPVKRSDVIITEPVDPRLFPNLREHSLHITFRDGRVIEVQRVAGL